LSHSMILEISPSRFRSAPRKETDKSHRDVKRISLQALWMAGAVDATLEYVRETGLSVMSAQETTDRSGEFRSNSLCKGLIL
jgi:hypothetical protein